MPNPAHKRTTTEAGPPRWSPKKEACPEDLTVADRDELLRASYSEDGDPLNPKRYAVRRVAGRLELYRTLPTVEHADGRIEVHGHPFQPGYPKIPPAVLRRMRDDNVITPPEYKDLVNS